MRKVSLIIQILFIGILMAAVPAWIFYTTDSGRVEQLNLLEKKIINTDNQKSISIIREQIQQKLDTLAPLFDKLSEETVLKKYSSVLENPALIKANYVKAKDLKLVKAEYLKNARAAGGESALLDTKGKAIETNTASLKSLNLGKEPKFLNAVNSDKKNPLTKDINYSEGSASYFMPVFDAKGKAVSVLYVRENFSTAVEAVRKEILPKAGSRGATFVVDETGKVIIHNDRKKENNEVAAVNPELKFLSNPEASNSEILEEVKYDNSPGFFGYVKNPAAKITVCVFTASADYSELNKKGVTYSNALLDKTNMAVMGGVFILAFIMALMISASPFKPASKIVAALAHLDEESFEELLPKEKKGEYKKLIDSILILRGRVKSSESNANKLSAMSKELEEELSKESTRSDREISELQDALKTAGNAKSNLETDIAKLKNEIEKAKKDEQAKAAGEAALLNTKIATLEKEKEALKNDVKKASEVKVSSEKEALRNDSVLMMNTELKAVLSVIKTYISSALGGESKITDAQQQFLGVVINKSARLERLINDLTELAKLEKGDVQLAKKPVDLNNLVQEVVFSVQPQAEIKKVDLKLNFSPSQVTTEADSVKLAGIVSQLLTQAIKVSPRGGAVTVETKEDKDNVIIKMTDLGMSLPPIKAQSLFLNFHGAESPTGPEFLNTGLRFPILKALMKNMGGDIWIESEIGKGKAFIVSMLKSGKEPAKPTAQAQPAQAPAIIPAAMPAAPMSATVQAATKPPEMKIAAVPPAAPASGITQNKFQGIPPAAPSVAAVPPPSAAPKIQRNTFEIPPPMPPDPDGTPDFMTVKNIMQAKGPNPSGPVPNIPGKDFIVPQSLAGVPPPQSPKKTDLPGELPPLPELSDDKGNDII